jgi:hypothetical protein
LALGWVVCFLTVAGEGLFCAKVWGACVQKKMLLNKMPNDLKKSLEIVSKDRVFIN